MAKKGLAQANTLRSNNIGENGYGIVYADEVAGHRTVKTLANLYALYPWVLSASGTNDNQDAIGQLWWVADPNNDKNATAQGCFYQLKDWNNRGSAEGWKKFETGTTINPDNFLNKNSDAVSNDDIDDIWNGNN